LHGSFVIIYRHRLGGAQHVAFTGHIRLQFGFDDGDISASIHR
jgi:hypothetical protein